jgi:hypothetical protein
MAKEEKSKWEMAKWEKAKREYTVDSANLFSCIIHSIRLDCFGFVSDFFNCGRIYVDSSSELILLVSGCVDFFS